MRRKKASADPIRKLWLRGCYADTASLLREGAIPEAATLRRLLSPRRLGPAHEAANSENGPDFSEALARLAAAAPAALRSHPDMLSTMIENRSARFALGILCSWRGAISRLDGRADDALRAAAIEALLSLDPEAISEHTVTGVRMAGGISLAANGGHRSMRMAEEVLWTLAPRLTSLSSAALYSHAKKSERMHPLDAWIGLQSLLSDWREPSSTRPLLDIARAPNPEAFHRGLAKIAIAHYRSAGTGKLSWHVDSLLGIARELCLTHADMPGALDCQALLGSTGLESSWRLSKRACFFPSPLGRTFSGDMAAELDRGLSALAWFDGCARLTAELGAPDMHHGELANDRLEKTYKSCRDAANGIEQRLASLAPRLLAQPFPLSPPTLAEAFNLRKSSLEIERATEKTPPVRPSRSL